MVVTFTLALVVSAATFILYLRSRRHSALVMVLGVILYWAAAVLSQFGPTTMESSHSLGAGEDWESIGETPDHEIHQEVVRYTPHPMVQPMLLLGGSMLSLGFLVFAWNSERREDD